MARHDRTLVHPSRGRLVEELTLAQARANEESAVLAPLGQRQWEEVAARIGETPEGRQQWSDSRGGDTARVAVSWWTDQIGRRHFRIVGGNSRDGSCRNLTSTRTDPRPPLWHLYPERVFWRERGGVGEWAAVCGCGEAGAAAKLGWMGRCCAVCHDRAQEGDQIVAPVAVPVLGPHHGTPCAVAFSPDGRWLASVGAGSGLSWVRLDEIHGDAYRELPAQRDLPTCLAFSPDGKLLAGTEGITRLMVRDLDSEELVLDHEEDFGIDCLAFAPDGLTLAIGGHQGLQLWDRQGRAGSWQLAHAAETPAQALAWSPAGDRLAVGAGQGVCIVERTEGYASAVALVPAASHAVWDLAFVEAGKGLVCLTGLDPRRWWEHQGNPESFCEVRHCDLAASAIRETAAHPLPALSAGRFSRDGRRLACFRRGDPTIHLRSALSGESIGRVGWDLERPVNGVVFSPDSESVAAIDEAGTIKLIPWRLLLREPGA